MKEWKKSVKFHLKIVELSWLLVFNISSVQPRNGIRIKILSRVILSEQLHPQHGEDVNDDEKDECEVPESAKSGDDDTKKHLHSGPGLSQF